MADVPFALRYQLSIDQLTAGVWTLQHWSGSVVHIPADAITEAQLAHLRAAMERGRTPEGVQAAVERGRRLAELEREESSGRGPYSGQVGRG